MTWFWLIVVLINTGLYSVDRGINLTNITKTGGHSPVCFQSWECSYIVTKTLLRQLFSFLGCLSILVSYTNLLKFLFCAYGFIQSASSIPHPPLACWQFFTQFSYFFFFFLYSYPKTTLLPFLFQFWKHKGKQSHHIHFCMYSPIPVSFYHTLSTFYKEFWKLLVKFS